LTVRPRNIRKTFGAPEGGAHRRRFYTVHLRGFDSNASLRSDDRAQERPDAAIFLVGRQLAGAGKARASSQPTTKI